MNDETAVQQLKIENNSTLNKLFLNNLQKVL
jgi:hypothetical protein